MKLKDLPFGIVAIRKATFCSLYWYHGTGLRRLLIRLVALFCFSKLVLQLVFSHLHSDESVCVITILMPVIKVIMMSAV